VRLRSGAAHRLFSILPKHFLDIPAFPPHPLQARGRRCLKLEGRMAMRMLAMTWSSAFAGEKAGRRK
jgi:hypothetical protein